MRIATAVPATRVPLEMPAGRADVEERREVKAGFGMVMPFAALEHAGQTSLRRCDTVTGATPTRKLEPSGATVTPAGSSCATPTERLLLGTFQVVSHCGIPLGTSHAASAPRAATDAARR